MKKIIFPIVLLFTLLACEREPIIELPETEQLFIKKVDNSFPIYLFYDETKTDGIRISNHHNPTKTTQVLYIDKRLLLKHVIPHVKHFKKDVNTNTSVKQYIVALETTSKAPSFIDISTVAYMDEDEFSKFYVKEFPEPHMQVLTLGINFKADGKITVDGHSIDPSELLIFLKNYIDFVSEGKQTLIYLNFDETLSFQYYIANYNRIMGLNGPHISIASRQFVYNESLLPDCNCVL